MAFSMPPTTSPKGVSQGWVPSDGMALQKAQGNRYSHSSVDTTLAYRRFDTLTRRQ